MRAVRLVYESLQSTQPCDTRSRAVAVWDEVMHLMNDPRQEPMGVLLALVAKCKLDRDVACVYDYLKARSSTKAPPPAITNQAFAAQQEKGPGSSGRACYRFFRGDTCKYGADCRHQHPEKGSAGRRAFEQNPAEMERDNTWLESLKTAAAGTPTTNSSPPAAANTATAKTPKKKTKKKA